MTLLKEAASAESKNKESTHGDNNETISQNKNTKCCDICQVKPSSKRKYDINICSKCALWFHEVCVGIAKDEPVGIWLCKTCRDRKLKVLLKVQMIE